MKRHLKVFVSLGFFVAARVHDWALRVLGFGRPRLVILSYHAVPAESRHRFARQLDLARAGACAVVAADFSGPARSGQLLVAITFDDAFTSVVDNALPELAARGMPATIFTPSGMLGRSPTWEMEISDPDRIETVAGIDVLRGLSPDAVLIGAHSVTHPRLPKVGPKAAAAEITESKAQLERLLGRKVLAFAFPYGEYDEAMVDVCRAAGYRFAFTIVPKVVDPTANSFLRGRIPVRLDDSTLEFWLKMRGAYAWMEWASGIKARFGRRGSAWAEIY